MSRVCLRQRSRARAANQSRSKNTKISSSAASASALGLQSTGLRLLLFNLDKLERRQAMYHHKLLPAALILACLVLVSVAVAAPVSNDQPPTPSANPIRTSLQSDLTLKSSLSPEFLPQAPGTQAGGLRTCRCSCGFPCRTNADCGPGGVCAPGITCCNRSPQDPQNAWLQGAALASRSKAAPDLNIKCK